jgi:hypothetical protein
MTLAHQGNAWSGALALAIAGLAATACAPASPTGATPAAGPPSQSTTATSPGSGAGAITCTAATSSQAKPEQAAQCFYAASLEGNFRRASQYAFDPASMDNYPALAALQTAPATSRQARFAGCGSVRTVPGLDTPPDSAPMRCTFPYPDRAGQRRVDIYVLQGSDNGYRVFAVGLDGQAVPNRDTLPQVNYNQGG